MDNFDTDSNDSYHSGSFLSNASSLSGLSLYENEFVELRHFVNPSKYPTSTVKRNSTPRVHLETVDVQRKIQNLQNDLDSSLQLNVKYKNDLIHLEQKIEAKFCDKLEKLTRDNKILEGQLENANGQIKRLIKNYKDQDSLVLFADKLNLENRIQDLSYQTRKLEKECAILEKERDSVNLENKTIKISLAELTTNLDIRKIAVQDLKEKVTQQHVENQKLSQKNTILSEKLNAVSAKLENCEKSNNWYREKLKVLQNDNENAIKSISNYKSEVNCLQDKISSLNIELCKCKNEIDQVRFQALQEKETLYAKLESINVNFNLPQKSINNNINVPDLTSYDLVVEDLKSEISRLKTICQEKDAEFEFLKKENSDILAKYLILQKQFQQLENKSEQLEKSKNYILKKNEFLNENLKEKLCENLQLKNKIVRIEVQLKTQNEEKRCTEDQVQVIRNQVLSFKMNYEKIKNELNVRNKEMLELHNDRQQLFMKHNWAKCELEKFKEKDTITDSLKKDILSLEQKISEQNKNITQLKFEILKKEKIVEVKENCIGEKQKELDHYDLVILQYKNMHSELENKINSLQNNSKTLEDENIRLKNNISIIKNELKSTQLNLDNALENTEQLKIDHAATVEGYEVKNNIMSESLINTKKEFNLKLEEKETIINDLQVKLKKLESEYGIYLKRNTDDHKVELLNLLNNDKFLLQVFDRLNLDEFEKSVGVRLKHLEEKIQRGNAECYDIREKIKEKDSTIKGLELQLQVKAREMQDKQQKNDRNNRTLLRKLKEHMRGRNSSEKQLKYLQDLYDSLSDKYNTLMLSVTSKDCSIESLEEASQKYKTEVKKHKDVILNLENKLSEVGHCAKCAYYETTCDKLKFLEKFCAEVQEKNKDINSEVIASKETIHNLNLQLKEKSIEVDNLSNKISNYQNDLNIVTSKGQEYNKEIQKLSEELACKNTICAKNELIIENLKQDLKDVSERNYFLFSEREHIFLNLQQKSELLIQVEESKIAVEDRLSKETISKQNLILGLQKNLHLLNTEIVNLRNDKFFLQRLSNDLKVALKSYAEQNKTLKDQLDLMSKENHSCNSLSALSFHDFSSNEKYDESLINRLLTDHKTPALQKPVTSEIQGCLRKLREEIANLQDEIVRKNQQL